MNATVDVAVIGGGPAGLMAAEAAASSGASVVVFEQMPSVGRKLLIAGKGGLNLTHAEPFALFVQRFGAARARLEPLLRAFGPLELRAWAAGLGIATRIGSSSRVFPVDFKAAPLLRRWVHRLRAQGVMIATRHRWRAWNAMNEFAFDTPDGERRVTARAAVLAPGGASWPRLGADGTWSTLLAQRGVRLTPFAATNCGFEVDWSEHLRQRWAGHPVKPVAVSSGSQQPVRGEFVITRYGLEGGAVYALSTPLRAALAADGVATLRVDLAPDRPVAALTKALAEPRGSRSIASHLRRKARLEGVKSALLHEILPREVFLDPTRLAKAIKHLPITVRATRPLAEAISTAGGVDFAEVDEDLMLRSAPGVFVAGEMLDWEAPTGGYLLTACWATGRCAGEAAARYATGGLRQR